MKDSKKLYRIAENLSSDLYSYQDGETDVNTIYRILETGVEIAKKFQVNCPNKKECAYFLLSSYCHDNNVYMSALYTYRNALICLIEK